MTTTYKIIRFFQNSKIENETIATGLTLEEAQEHCSDPETSWKKCKTKSAVARTEQFGPWFDGFTEE